MTLCGDSLDQENEMIFENQPKYFDFLNEEDKITYNKLRSTLSSHLCRNRRGKRLETFSDMLTTIQNFCIRNDGDDWKRFLVCGVCWLPLGLAINTRQLSLLITKCKSSINGSLQKMGYGTIQSRSESSNALSDVIPFLKNNFNELREWSIRQFIAVTPQPQNLPFNLIPQQNQFFYPPFISPKPKQQGLNEFIPPQQEKSFPIPNIDSSNFDFPLQYDNNIENQDNEDLFSLVPTFFYDDDNETNL